MPSRFLPLPSLPAAALLLVAGCGGADQATGPPASGEIDESGGTVRTAGGQVQLVFPPGAVSGPIRVSVERVEDPPEESGLLPGAVFEFGPDGVEFAEPVELTLRYDADQLPEGATETSLATYRLADGGWERIESSRVDSTADEIRAHIRGFSVYAVISDHRCVEVDPLVLGEVVSGELSASDCAIWDGRRVDKFAFSFPEQTAFRATVSSEDFTGSVFTGRVSEGVDRVISTEIGSAVHIVAPGSYQLWPTSLESEKTTGTPVVGSYELTAERVEGHPTDGCGPAVTVTRGVTVNGAITADDCEETDDDDPEVVRRTDEYLLALGRPEMATVTLTADFRFNLLAWADGRLVKGMFAREPGSTATITVDPPWFTTMTFGAVSDVEGAEGSYTISFDIGPREE